jgi:hypothetical protein
MNSSFILTKSKVHRQVSSSFKVSRYEIEYSSESNHDVKKNQGARVRFNPSTSTKIYQEFQTYTQKCTFSEWTQTQQLSKQKQLRHLLCFRCTDQSESNVCCQVRNKITAIQELQYCSWCLRNREVGFQNWLGSFIPQLTQLVNTQYKTSILGNIHLSIYSSLSKVIRKWFLTDHHF